MHYAPLTDPVAALPYLGMTYPAHRDLLMELGPDGPAVAVTAADGDRPAGLALAGLGEDGISAEVVSLFTGTEYRGRGVGTALLAHLEAELTRQDVTEATLVFPADRPASPAVERILAKRGWEPPQPRMYLVTLNHTSMTTALTAPWMRRSAVPEDYTVFPWAELTADERADILARQEAEPWYPLMLSPFNNEARLEPKNSLGLRYRGSVVGWMITHRITPDTLRYTALFVRPDVPAKGVGFGLLVEAVRQQIEKLSDDRFAVFGVYADNPMIGFLRRRVLPNLGVESIVTTMQSRKTLAPAADGGGG